MAKYSPKSGQKVEQSMHEMKEGKLRSGRSNKKVTNPQQAIAIGLSEARAEGAKVPKKAARKKVAKKAAPRKRAVKKAAVRKAAPRKNAIKKAAPRKRAVKKAAPRKRAVKKAAVKRASKHAGA
ncbi:DUF6496 domain-containing protein [Deminuibacter soli]|uniref:Histone H1-like protein n=1 Tax=Deminuibacter soli TaxID=2291815 RepID=A0A3E1NGT6_9BACT|nr:DUF6496 domain-containing protein [Deminuibacter soli]RFM27165.1 histone H1-like protein [Deminuibacter soli]